MCLSNYEECQNSHHNGENAFLMSRHVRNQHFRDSTTLYGFVDFSVEGTTLKLPESLVHDGHMCTMLVISCTGTKVA